MTWQRASEAWTRSGSAPLRTHLSHPNRDKLNAGPCQCDAPQGILESMADVEMTEIVGLEKLVMNSGNPKRLARGLIRSVLRHTPPLGTTDSMPTPALLIARRLWPHCCATTSESTFIQIILALRP
ncbi:uncharacterized protein VDAG_07590 [Verticillium dahliae VdLs.17]|uniref:Uncharacterized protein n=1 Tax=Verticillium dahliae (strain VdLs.17 / ATCC MYA-4575 / FGSC 10137) TaxID=498257 RepID=G2XC12_VERDV|nr:uncharacterized protein VDAG_07590 [Verticillium dahliae VdLs.17]EGY16426.1 hypothetical protein VDAG_07590 [Verticillium dahliae VdLs.17]